MVVFRKVKACAAVISIGTAVFIHFFLPGDAICEVNSPPILASTQRVKQFLFVAPGSTQVLAKIKAARRRVTLKLARYAQTGVELRATTVPRRSSDVRLSIREISERQSAVVNNSYEGQAKRSVLWFPEPGRYLVSAVPYSSLSSAQVVQGRKALLKVTVKKERKPRPRPTAAVTATATPTNIITPFTPDPTIPPHTPTPFPQPTQTPPLEPIPGLESWQAHMLSYGRLHCNEQEIAELSTWEGNIWYYDGLRVYFQIADYTGDQSWNDCARYVRSVYRNYVIEESGAIGGWRVFAEGLAEDYRRTSDGQSKEAALQLANNSAFAWAGGGAGFELSRETAYLLNAYLTAVELGEAPHANLQQSVEYALGHLDQWAVSQSADYVQPFMVGLTFEALIRYYEKFGDERIPYLIEIAADWLWNKAWDDSTKAFHYMVCEHDAAYESCHDGPAPDLNLLIAPAYAWLYKRSGSHLHRDRADAAFTGGVEGAWLGNGKQFSQNYRWSFDYIKWRQSR
jgi:hypothetical protein